MVNCKWLVLVAVMLLVGMTGVRSQEYYPKREFRGAWIQCVNGQFQGMAPAKMKATLIQQLDDLQGAGINAIIFQVRAECDALYKSTYEPWSRFLTGVQGQAPSQDWDPLQFMITECHKRGMELHAWINPYRAKTKSTVTLAENHPYNKFQNLFVEYGDQLYFDPGYKESRTYVCKIITDIVTRYNIDGLHIDDYFYPYPIEGQEFPDDTSFKLNRKGFRNRDDWRRDNINILIKEIHETIRECKPWVKFGVAPFGIYRNYKSDPNGSKTSGLQNYDDLYADVLLWVNNGWVDYIIPQVYWEIGNKAADYETLVEWWAKHAAARPIYIGQDVERTVKFAAPNKPKENQTREKYRIQRMYTSVQGSCQWYAAAVERNPGNYRTLLEKQIHKYPALMPSMPFIDKTPPDKPKDVKAVWTDFGYVLFWTVPRAKTVFDEVMRYVVYRFESGEKVNLEDPSHIVAITDECNYLLPFKSGKKKYKYVVTALDRLQNESKAVVKKVKL